MVFCLCMKYLLGTTELICAKFTLKMCLVPHSDEFEGQRSRSPGTKKRHFWALSAACVRFMFGKTSLVVFIMAIRTWVQLHAVMLKSHW